MSDDTAVPVNYLPDVGTPLWPSGRDWMHIDRPDGAPPWTVDYVDPKGRCFSAGGLHLPFEALPSFTTKRRPWWRRALAALGV